LQDALCCVDFPASAVSLRVLLGAIGGAVRVGGTSVGISRIVSTIELGHSAPETSRAAGTAARHTGACETSVRTRLTGTPSRRREGSPTAVSSRGERCASLRARIATAEQPNRRDRRESKGPRIHGSRRK
jgi:hypothetical protein